MQTIDEIQICTIPNTAIKTFEHINQDLINQMLIKVTNQRKAIIQDPLIEVTKIQDQPKPESTQVTGNHIRKI